MTLETVSSPSAINRIPKSQARGRRGARHRIRARLQPRRGIWRGRSIHSTGREGRFSLADEGVPGGSTKEDAVRSMVIDGDQLAIALD